MSPSDAQSRRFKQVDVFTAQAYLGNPLAVVLDGAGLSDEAMQRFARWTNLSETTFVLPPTNAQADYRVRIFTPGGELPFAGHPTLGTCHAWLEAGGTPRQAGVVVQECQIGLVRIEPHGTQRAFAAPPCQRSAPAPTLLAQVCNALGLRAQQVLAAQLLDNGPQWLGLLLDSPQTVLALRPDHATLKNLKQKVGVAAVHIAQAATKSAAISSTPQLEVRAFAAPVGIEEDPVTGSLNASLAQWLLADGTLHAPYTAAQGTAMGRAGRVSISQDASGQVWVGGDSVTCISGTVQL
jgi:PhzF family phenazine biosynthesis protein